MYVCEYATDFVSFLPVAHRLFAPRSPNSAWPSHSRPVRLSSYFLSVGVKAVPVSRGQKDTRNFKLILLVSNLFHLVDEPRRNYLQLFSRSLVQEVKVDKEVSRSQNSRNSNPFYGFQIRPRKKNSLIPVTWGKK